jgi:hypothetical protein
MLPGLLSRWREWLSCEVEPRWIIVVLIAVGAVIVVGLGLAALYDHRARRRGWRVGVSGEAALENRVNTAATNLEPFVHHDDPPRDG